MSSIHLTRHAAGWYLYDHSQTRFVVLHAQPKHPLGWIVYINNRYAARCRTLRQARAVIHVCIDFNVAI